MIYYDNTSASMSIGGQWFDVESIRWSRSNTDDRSRPALASSRFEASVTMSLQRGTLERLWRLFRPRSWAEELQRAIARCPPWPALVRGKPWPALPPLLPPVQRPVARARLAIGARTHAPTWRRQRRRRAHDRR